VPDAVHSVGAAISKCRGMLADDETLGLLTRQVGADDDVLTKQASPN